MKESSELTGGLAALVIGAIFFLVVVLTFIGHDERLTALEKAREVTSIEIHLEQPEFLLKGPREGLMEALEYYQVPHADIVYSQAYLETGNFKSNLNVNSNNLFGLYNSKLDRYMMFDHWIGSVEAYKKYFSDRYIDTTEDYYHFLSRVNYAEDPEYNKKVETIRKQLFDD